MRLAPQASANTRQSQRLPWIGFGITLLFLVLIAVVADHITTRLADDEEWVSHTQEVERVLGRLRGDLFAADSSQLLSLAKGGEVHIEPYYSNSQRIPEDLDLLKSLLADNASQEAHLDALREVVNRRMGIMRESLALRKGGQENDQHQSDLTVTGAALSNQSISMVQNMRDEEDRLLKKRQTISQHTYEAVRVILAVAFGVVIIVLAGNFRRLLIELRERRQAQESVLRLNRRILQVQDEERRRVARELHDSIGQVFAAMKMNVSMLADGEASDAQKERRAKLFAELQKLVDQGISEARTLSHLLHPPLLDELGLASAAHWLVDGFSQRSGIQVKLELPEKSDRLPAPIELVLFRVLQESLTNIHRHSGSPSADIRIEQTPDTVTLTVRDYGKGIPGHIVETYRKTSAGLGVGLAGMRERVIELNGRLDLHSEQPGTRLQVILPLPLAIKPHPVLRPAAEEEAAGLSAD